MTQTPHRDSFDHRKLVVYQLCLEFFKEARLLALRLRGPDIVLRNQFIRAALSMPLNTAEGSGELRPREKGKFYRIARRSANECVAILDTLEFVLGMTPAQLDPYYGKLRRIIVMLVALDKAMEVRAASVVSKKRHAPRPMPNARHKKESGSRAPTRDPPS